MAFELNCFRDAIIDDIEPIRKAIIETYQSATGANEDKAGEIADLVATAARECIEKFFDKVNLVSDANVGIATLATGASVIAQLFTQIAGASLSASIAAGLATGVTLAQVPREAE